MFIVMYRHRNGNRLALWQAHGKPFTNRQAAQTMCDELLSYTAAKGQQEYAKAVPVFVEPE